jgi:hydrogenase maturation protease
MRRAGLPATRAGEAAPLDADTVVVGVGNIVHSDDGAGVHALQMLRDAGEAPAGALLLDGGTLGLELLSYLQNARRILFLDAVDACAEPGTTLRIETEVLRGMRGSWNVHQLGVADLLNALALVSVTPQEIVLLGVQPESTDWGSECTPPVKRALPQLVNAALEQLRSWSKEPANLRT